MLHREKKFDLSPFIFPNQFIRRPLHACVSSHADTNSNISFPLLSMDWIRQDRLIEYEICVMEFFCCRLSFFPIHRSPVALNYETKTLFIHVRLSSTEWNWNNFSDAKSRSLFGLWCAKKTFLITFGIFFRAIFEVRNAEI